MDNSYIEKKYIKQWFGPPLTNAIIPRTPIPTREKLLDPRMNTRSCFSYCRYGNYQTGQHLYVLLLLVVWRGRGCHSNFKPLVLETIWTLRIEIKIPKGENAYLCICVYDCLWVGERGGGASLKKFQILCFVSKVISWIFTSTSAQTTSQ